MDKATHSKFCAYFLRAQIQLWPTAPPMRLPIPNPNPKTHPNPNPIFSRNPNPFLKENKNDSRI